MHSVPVLGATAALWLCGAAPAFAFSASFTWCSQMPGSTTSPAFAVSGAPKGTVALDLRMTDRDVPQFQHGGGKVAFTGGRVPCGAIPYGWIGPTPPAGVTHTYEFTIDALGATGAVLATARAARKFP